MPMGQVSPPPLPDEETAPDRYVAARATARLTEVGAASTPNLTHNLPISSLVPEDFLTGGGQRPGCVHHPTPTLRWTPFLRLFRAN